jgi:hypothetical protein
MALGAVVNIFFDVDYTILSADYTIRPGTREIFDRLVNDGHQVYIWSGEGLRWTAIRDHKLDQYVADVFHKPTWNHVARLEELGVPMIPDFVVDDYPEIVAAFGGFFVSEYFIEQLADQEMYAVYQTICEHVRHGTSDHHRYRPRPAPP